MHTHYRVKDLGETPQDPGGDTGVTQKARFNSGFYVGNPGTCKNVSKMPCGAPFKPLFQTPPLITVFFVLK